MALAHSRITTQGQISVPKGVRVKLGVGPGSVLEWEEDGDRVFVRRSGRFASEDIRRAVFPVPAKTPRTLEELKEGIGQYIEERHARR